MSIVLTQLNIYPIKSCKGISLQSAGLEERGLQYDRRWMIVDEQLRFVSQREMPRLALVSVALQSDHLAVAAPGMNGLHIPHIPAEKNVLTVTVWRDRVLALDLGEDAASWFSEYLGLSARLVFMPDTADRSATRAGHESQVSFVDAYPLLLISEASLDHLNQRLEEPLPMNRFRPNLVVGGCEPYAEDTWGQIMIGSAKMHVVKPCDRCVTTTVDQSTGRKGTEPLRALRTYRKHESGVMFGQNLIHEGKGMLSVGDEVRVKMKKSNSDK